MVSRELQNLNRLFLVVSQIAPKLSGFLRRVGNSQIFFRKSFLISEPFPGCDKFGAGADCDVTDAHCKESCEDLLNTNGNLDQCLNSALDQLDKSAVTQWVMEMIYFDMGCSFTESQSTE